MTATSENGTSISDDETDKLIDEGRNKAEAYGQLMIDFIKENPNDYPVYWTTNGAYRTFPKGTAFECPIYLPNVRNVLDNETIREIGSGKNGFNI